MDPGLTRLTMKNKSFLNRLAIAASIDGSVLEIPDENG